MNFYARFIYKDSITIGNTQTTLTLTITTSAKFNSLINTTDYLLTKTFNKLEIWFSNNN